MLAVGILSLALVVLIVSTLSSVPAGAASRLRQVRTWIVLGGKALGVTVAVTFDVLLVASIPLALLSLVRDVVGLPQRVVTTVRLQGKALFREDDPETHRDDLQQLVELGQSDGIDAVSAQARFLATRRKGRWPLMPWRLIPGPGLSVLPEGSRQAEAIALATIDTFLAPVPDEDADGELAFSEYLREACYSLTLGHWHGPLAGAWRAYEVRLGWTSSGWVITDARAGAWNVS